MSQLSHSKEIVKQFLEISNTFVELLSGMIIFKDLITRICTICMYHWCLAPSIDIANLAAHESDFMRK